MKPTPIPEHLEAFSWDKLLSALNAWDKAERAVFQAHIDMIEDVYGALSDTPHGRGEG